MKKIGIIVIALLLLGGCTFMNEKETLTDEEVKQEMLSYAEEKYKKEFEVAGDFHHVNNSKSSPFTIQLKTKGSVGRYDVFTVKRTRKGDSILYEDSYSNLHYRELAYKEIEPIVKKHFANHHILIMLIWDTQKKTDMSMTYHEALIHHQAGSANIRIFVEDNLYTEEERKHKFTNLYQELFNKYESGLLSLYPLNGNDNEHILKYQNLYEYFEKYYTDSASTDEAKRLKRKRISIHWLEGEIITDER